MKASHKGAGSLYSPSCREGLFSEAHILDRESLSNRTGAKSQFAPRWARWGTQHVARPNTYAVGEDPSQSRATGETTLRVATLPSFRASWRSNCERPWHCTGVVCFNAICRAFRSEPPRTRTWNLEIKSLCRHGSSSCWKLQNWLKQAEFIPSSLPNVSYCCSGLVSKLVSATVFSDDREGQRRPSEFSSLPLPVEEWMLQQQD